MAAGESLAEIETDKARTCIAARSLACANNGVGACERASLSAAQCSGVACASAFPIRLTIARSYCSLLRGIAHQPAALL